MVQNKVVDIIINLISGVKTNNLLTDNIDGEKIELYNCKYLLSQVLRQINLPKEHLLVSEKAYELWSKISTDDITDYKYRDVVCKTTDDYVAVDKYKASNKEPYIKGAVVKKGETFVFNDVFIDEHIVPINNIIIELLSLTTYDYPSVKKILDKIYICKMLKYEDHMIKNKSNRSAYYKEVIVEDYLDVGIRIRDFDYLNANKELLEKYQTKLLDVERKETAGWKKCPKCETNIIRKDQEMCNICLGEIKETKKTVLQTNSGKKKKRDYAEKFRFTSIKKRYRGKNGYQAINSKNEEIGIVYMHDIKRRASYGYCELCIYAEFQKAYGEWHIIYSNGNRIKWEDLCLKLSNFNTCDIYID